MKEPVKEFAGKILGFREDQGNRVVATDFLGVQLGYYDKARNKTYDFYGREVCTGDGTSGLIMNAAK